MYQLFESLLNLLLTFDGAPDFVRGPVDNVPVLQVIRQLGQISLLLLPYVAILDMLSRANYNKRRVLVLDLTTSLRVSSSKEPATKLSCSLAKINLPFCCADRPYTRSRLVRPRKMAPGFGPFEWRITPQSPEIIREPGDGTSSSRSSL